MDPLVLCDALPVRVAAGGEARVPLTVHNPGEATDHYRCDVLGDAAHWSRIEPRHLPGVAGGDRAVIELVLRPPADAPSGSRPVGVRCVSLQDGERAAVVEGEITVGAAHDLEVTVAPVAPRGRAGHYVVELRNSGTSEVDVRLSATDPRQELGFALAPRELTVAPDESARAYLSARPRRPKLAGRAVAHRFSVEHRQGSGAKARLPLSFEQRPVLGPAAAAGTAVLALAATAVAGVLVWPSVRGLLPDDGGGTTTGAAPSTVEGTGDPVQGYYVLWQTTPVDDVALQGAPLELLDKLQAGGIQARIVDSRQSDRLEDGAAGFWVVLQDGFTDEAAAEAACHAEAVALDCVDVVPPEDPP